MPAVKRPQPDDAKGEPQAKRGKAVPVPAKAKKEKQDKNQQWQDFAAVAVRKDPAGKLLLSNLRRLAEQVLGRATAGSTYFEKALYATYPGLNNREAVKGDDRPPLYQIRGKGKANKGVALYGISLANSFPRFQKPEKVAAVNRIREVVERNCPGWKFQDAYDELSADAEPATEAKAAQAAGPGIKVIHTPGKSDNATSTSAWSRGASPSWTSPWTGCGWTSRARAG
eukprot:TRINITY_DN7526_c0_g1_i3.p2 TRINITY_DN7526_c0_g1~~TRINITY_DN7526_c0_g1_i3.p2  ORF type:complete len:227 (-),score=61.58 TRINITY_DN7526_c0_g1_i3:1108-1788(-)